MTDETTPAAPDDSANPVDPAAPVPSAESEFPVPSTEPEWPAESAVPDPSGSAFFAASEPSPAGVSEPAFEAAPETTDAPPAEPTEAAAATPGETTPAEQPAAAVPAAVPLAAPEAASQTAVMPAVAAPAVGPTIPSGSRVVIMVSRGPSPMAPSAFVTVPLVAGMTQGDALAKLQEAGLPSQVFNDYNEKLPRGEVMGQLPEPGSSVAAGAESVLMVSSGPAAAPTIATTLPYVVGIAESDAVSRLQAAGLSPQLVREYSQNVPDGVVMAQLPNASTLIDAPKRRSLLWLWIVLAALVVAALGVGAYLYLNRTGIVPAVVGLTQADATTAITSAGFKVGTIETTQTLKAADVGKVVAQSPTANTESKMNSGVDIVVSGGQRLLEVPTVTGKTQADAELALKDAGLTATVSQGFSATVVKGIVISQAPKAGQKVPSETSVGIVVSEGAQNVTVPGLTAQSKANATSLLKSLGLGVQIISGYSATVKSGQVADQFPAAGTAVPPGTITGLLISDGPASAAETSAGVSVPSVIDRPLSQAESLLKSATYGLKPIAVQWTGTGKPANQVVGQLPDSSTLAAKGSQVLLFVSNGK